MVTILIQYATSLLEQNYFISTVYHLKSGNIVAELRAT